MTKQKTDADTRRTDSGECQPPEVLSDPPSTLSESAGASGLAERLRKTPPVLSRKLLLEAADMIDRLAAPVQAEPVQSSIAESGHKPGQEAPRLSDLGWRTRAAVAQRCIFDARSGCIYPDCSNDCGGRKNLSPDVLVSAADDLRTAQRAYMADRGNHAKGKLVAWAADSYDRLRAGLSKTSASIRDLSLCGEPLSESSNASPPTPVSGERDEDRIQKLARRMFNRFHNPALWDHPRSIMARDNCYDLAREVLYAIPVSAELDDMGKQNGSEKL